MSNEREINRLTAHLFRENSGKMIAVLSRIFGFSQIDKVTDIIQDTFEAALIKWRYSGIPDNPSGWLMQVAKNKASTFFKRENKTRLYSPSVYAKYFESEFEQQLDILLSPKKITDSQLRLLYLCCHPGFSAKNQIILTLNILCGFGVPEIAKALLMKDEAVKKALTRCKQSLKKMDNILHSENIDLSDENIKTVQTILYLMFNEGYKTTRGKETINKDLCFEAIRLAQLLKSKQCNLYSECCALISLMFFNLARFPARVDDNRIPLSLAEQDRSRWNKVFVEEGYYYLSESKQTNCLSRYHIEAIISSVHCAASTFEEIDWQKISWLYSQLEILVPASPLVSLNKIYAESYLTDAPDIIESLNTLKADPYLMDNFLLPATKGDVYKRNGDITNAQNAYEKAYGLAISAGDKQFLQNKLSQCQPEIKS